jgi:hypothetical protein
MASCARGKNSQSPKRSGFSKVVLSPSASSAKLFLPIFHGMLWWGSWIFLYFRGLLLCSVDQCLLAFGKRGIMAAGLPSLSALWHVLGMQHRILRTTRHIVVVHTRIASALLPIGFRVRCRVRDFGGGSESAWVWRLGNDRRRPPFLSQ